MKKFNIIHIGYHKTATSYLQKNLFINFKDTFYRVNQSEIRNTLILPSPLRYSNIDFLNLCKPANNKKVVISNEYLSSDIHRDDYRSMNNALRLKEALPNSKVIIGVREQFSMIKSSYSQYIKAKGSSKIEKYLLDPITNDFKFKHLEYCDLVNYYRTLFGQENVLVLPYEVLNKNPQLYIETVLNFIEEKELLDKINFQVEQKVNSSFKPIILHIKRYLNPFILKNLQKQGYTFYSSFLMLIFTIVNKFFSKIPTKKIDQYLSRKIDLKISNQIKGQFEESNRKLNNLTVFDLNELGYRM